MIQLPGREFRVPQETISQITSGDRALTVHELEAAKRQGSLVMTYDVLREVDPEAVAGEAAPTFPEPVVIQPSAEVMAGAHLLAQRDVELAG